MIVKFLMAIDFKNYKIISLVINCKCYSMGLCAACRRRRHERRNRCHKIHIIGRCHEDYGYTMTRLDVPGVIFKYRL
ncbi:hypothetical protein Glove_37g128 [Diversispora epigaea]|uniref:Uncharacterized protein n=1 Tax=Diversispora epigaea TaxID=1348612 RepID=A0A397JJ31_9GLOM|nr:hypothetical protein Glove_37g128 [Diversispora epigaea]